MATAQALLAGRLSHGELLRFVAAFPHNQTLLQEISTGGSVADTVGELLLVLQRRGLVADFLQYVVTERSDLEADVKALAPALQIDLTDPSPEWKPIPKLSSHRDKLQRRIKKLEGQLTAATSEVERRSVQDEIVKLKHEKRAGPPLVPRTLITGHKQRYVIDAKLGEGELGEVWRAWDLGPERDDDHVPRLVALKVLKLMWARDEAQRARFFSNARQIAEWNHPGTVRILLPKAEDGDVTYYVMEYYGLGNLQAVAKRDEWPVSRVLAVIAKAADVLASAHKRSLFHGHLKPGNILVTEDDQPKLTDFDDLSGTRASPLILGPSSHDDRHALDIFSLATTAIGSLKGEIDHAFNTNWRRELARLPVGDQVRVVLSQALSDPTRYYGGDIARFGEALRKVLPVKTTLPLQIETTPPGDDPELLHNYHFQYTDEGPWEDVVHILKDPRERLGYGPFYYFATRHLYAETRLIYLCHDVEELAELSRLIERDESIPWDLRSELSAYVYFVELDSETLSSLDEGVYFVGRDRIRRAYRRLVPNANTILWKLIPEDAVALISEELMRIRAQIRHRDVPEERRSTAARIVLRQGRDAH